MNPFETGERKNIPAVLIYAFRGDGRVLMIHRNARADDFHSGKWNGLGGKSEPDESAQETACREFAEEAGVQLPLDSFRALGVLQFPYFKPHKSEDWSVTVFTVELNDQEAMQVSSGGPEGSLHWIDPAQLMGLPLWEGDREFLPRVLEREAFVGTFWYTSGGLSRFWIQDL